MDLSSLCIYDSSKTISNRIELTKKSPLYSIIEADQFQPKLYTKSKLHPKPIPSPRTLKASSKFIEDGLYLRLSAIVKQTNDKVPFPAPSPAIPSKSKYL